MTKSDYRSIWRMIDRATDLRSRQKMREKHEAILMSAAASVLRPEDMRTLSTSLRQIVSASNDYDACKARLRLDSILRGKTEWI